MSNIKEWFLKHADEIPDEELLRQGYSQSDIDFLKNREEEESAKGLFLFR